MSSYGNHVWTKFDEVMRQEEQERDELQRLVDQLETE
jgi:hypothetical protein